MVWDWELGCENGLRVVIYSWCGAGRVCCGGFGCMGSDELKWKGLRGWVKAITRLGERDYENDDDEGLDVGIGQDDIR